MSTAKSDAPGEALERTGASAWDRRAIGFLFWLIGSALACWAIYILFPPLYRAESILRVEPAPARLFGAPTADRPSLDRFIETQSSFLSSNQILMRTLADPAIESLPLIRDAADKLEAVRSRLQVSNPPGAGLIRVALESEDPQEAADIVNSIVLNYFSMYKESDMIRTARISERLKHYLDRLREELRAKSSELAAASADGLAARELTEGADKPAEARSWTGVRPPGEQPDAATSFRTLNAEQYRKAADRLLQADLDLIEARNQPADAPGREARIASLRAFRTELRGVLAAQAVTPAPDAYRIKAIQQEIEALSKQRNAVAVRYEDVKFAERTDDVEVNLVDKAVVPAAPFSDNRIAYMILASLALLILAAADALTHSAARRARASA